MSSGDRISQGVYLAAKEGYWESVFTLTNPFLGLRGIEDEGTEQSAPGLYIAGLFNQSECLAPEIVNFPNLLPVWLEINGCRIGPGTARVASYDRYLDLRQGLLVRSVRYELEGGVGCVVASRRFVGFHDLQVGGVEYTFTLDGYDGPACIRTLFDAHQPSREGSYQYDETVKHFHVLRFGDQYLEDFYARVALRDRGTLVDFATHTGVTASVLRRYRKIFYETVVETIEVEVQAGEPCTVTKWFALADSRSTAPGAMQCGAGEKLARLKKNGFEVELGRSAAALGARWKEADVVIGGDDEAQRLLRYNIYQLLALGPAHTDAHAIGAKGLSTEHYGGHYFWDTEIYLLPFYLHAFPVVARNLLAFRVRTLDAARNRAREQGFEGCLWPWQSDELGNEGIRQTVTPDGLVLRRDILDQYHIVSDVAYACFRYLRQTGDESFFRTELLPLVVESLRFWKSFILRDQPVDAATFHIRKVMGPDEYHTRVDDNLYTNLLTRSIFQWFCSWLDDAESAERDDLTTRTQLDGAEEAAFRSIASRLHVPDPREGVIEQFAGYFELKDQPLTTFTEQGLPHYPDPAVGAGLPDAERQDAIQAHATQTQLIKQADALLALWLLPEQFSEETLQATFAYYDRRTLQYSSLSPGICAVVAAMAGERQRAFQLFRLGAGMDLEDVKRETETGLHTACHGGAWLGVIAGFAGVRATEEALLLRPRLPAHWKSLSFIVHYRGARVEVHCQGDTASWQSDLPVTVRVE